MNFKDNQGVNWPVEIKFKDVEMIEKFVRGTDGKPLRILDLADTGELYRLYISAREMIDVVFFCCLDQIKTMFSEKEFDESHQLELQIEPELRGNLLRKMGLWFGERLNGPAIESMTEAFKEAIVNFTRNPHQREALETVLKNQQKLAQSQSRRIQEESDHRLKMTEEAMEQKHLQEMEKTPSEIFQEIQKIQEIQGLGSSLLN